MIKRAVCTSCADVRRHLLAAAEADFQNAGLLDESPQRAAGMRLARALLAQERSGATGIDSAEWNWLVPDPGDKMALLGSNVFARRYWDCRIVFENRSVAVYAGEKLQQCYEHLFLV